MLSSLKALFFVLVLSLSFSAVKAQDFDFLKHRKQFDICSIKKQCSECYTCDEERYDVKIKNKMNNKVTGVSYKFYSEVFNKIITKEAKIQGNKIDENAIGTFYICVPRGADEHWIISEVAYADGSTNNYTLHDRLGNFIQEPDECDCNVSNAPYSGY
jgi:hypothetical protein